MKDVAIRTDLSKQVAAFVEGIESFRQNLKTWDADHVDAVRQHEIQLEALEKAAQQTKLVDLQKEVSVAKVEIARWMGLHLKANELDAGTINMDKMTANRYRNVADVPDYVYSYALDSAVFPTVNKVLSERKRYLGIKAACKAAGVKQSVLKRMISEGYSVFQAERELNPVDGDDDMGLDLTDDDVDFDQSFDVEAFDDAVCGVEDQMVALMDLMGDSRVEFSIDGYKLGISVLKRLRVATKRISEMFVEVKRSVK